MSMKRVRIAIILIIASSLLAACAGNATSTAAATPVTLQLQWVTQAQFAGYYVALDKGWYKSEGIDLTIMPGGPDQSAVDLVSSGQRDFGTAILADLAVAVLNQKPVIGISQIQQKNGLLLLSQASSGIRGPRDFEGKGVGLWLGSFEAQFNAMMAQQGIPSDAYSVVSQGFSMDDFLNGKLQVASAMIYNEYYVVLESGMRPEDVTIIDYADYGLDFPGDTLFTSKTTAADKPDLCTRMVRATLKGWEYAIAHPDEAVDIVMKYDTTGSLKREHQLSMMKEIGKLVAVDGREVGRSDDAVLQRTIDTLREFNVLKSDLPASDVMMNDFVDKARGR
jgi:NitT/TauT family transport system substrate-binding protein